VDELAAKNERIRVLEDEIACLKQVLFLFAPIGNATIGNAMCNIGQMIDD
jgi:hypothetical protein